MRTNLNDLNPQARQYVEFVAAKELAAQKRVRKIGNHCWFCGSDSKLLTCGCLYPESFGCSERNICADCARSHRKIASHVRDMLKFPRVNRSDSRRNAFFKLLRQAAEKIEQAEVDSGRLDLADALHCQMVPGEYMPWECRTEELRRTVLDGFRGSKFVRFQELEISLANEVTKATLMGVTRLLKSLR